DHHARPEQLALAVDFVDKVADHRLGHREICDHTVFHRANRFDIAGRTTQHVLGIASDSQDFAGLGTNGNHAGFNQHNAPASHKNEAVGGSQVDTDVGGYKITEGF